MSAWNLDGGVFAVSTGLLAAPSWWANPNLTFCRLIVAGVAILPVKMSPTFRDVINSVHVSAPKVVLLFFFLSDAPSPLCYPQHRNM